MRISDISNSRDTGVALSADNMWAGRARLTRLADDLACSRIDLLAIDEASHWVGVERTAEKEHVGLGAVDRIVYPSPTLLHANAAPLVLRQQTSFWHGLGDMLWKDHVPATNAERMGPAWRVAAGALPLQSQARALGPCIIARAHLYSNQSSWYFSEYCGRAKRVEARVNRGATLRRATNGGGGAGLWLATTHLDRTRHRTPGRCAEQRPSRMAQQHPPSPPSAPRAWTARA